MRKNDRPPRRPKQYNSKLMPVSSVLIELHSRGKSLESMRLHLEKNYQIRVERSTISRHLKKINDATLPTKYAGDHHLNRHHFELRLLQNLNIF